MSSIRLSKEIEERLLNLSTITSRPKSFYIKQALEKYLDDIEDIYVSLERITDKNRVLLTSQELIQKLNQDV